MKSHELIEHVKKSYEMAELEISKLSFSSIGQHILKMDGMSGKLWRHFLNNVSSFTDCNHLEIGTWMGSTFCSSIFENRGMNFACTVDNSSQFGDVFKVATCAIGFACASMEKSCPQIAQIAHDYKTLFDQIEFKCKFDTYYFDGPHDYDDQYNGIIMMKDHLNEEACVILVDDWNWEASQKGTYDALKYLDREILWSKLITTEPELGGENSDWHLKNRRQFSNWHNGVAIFVLGGKNEKSAD